MSDIIKILSQDIVGILAGLLIITFAIHVSTFYWLSKIKDYLKEIKEIMKGKTMTENKYIEVADN